MTNAGMPLKGNSKTRSHLRRLGKPMQRYPEVRHQQFSGRIFLPDFSFTRLLSMNRLATDLGNATACYFDYLAHRLFWKWYNWRFRDTRPAEANSIFPRTKLLFVHVPKTAGNSLRLYLKTIEDSQPVKDALSVSPEILPKHAKAAEVRARLGTDLYNEFFSFSFVRNPFDLMASSYFWWRQYAIYFRQHMSTAVAIRRMSFSEYITSPWGRYFINEQHGSMSDWFQEGNQDIVNYVGKVEDLEQELSTIFQMAMLDTTRHQIPRANQTRRPPYQALYDARAKEIVSERFADVIERFGYHFD